MVYSIEEFKADFEATPQSKKVEFLAKCLEVLDDKDILEAVSESSDELHDLQLEADIEMDTQCNILISDGKVKLYQCIESIDIYKSGESYYIQVDKVKDSLLEKWENSPFTNIISNMNDIVWIISDCGLGTLKRKNLFKDDLDKHFKNI